MFKPLHVACILLVVFFNSSFSFAQEEQHEDALIVNNTLTLHDLVEKALPNYPNSTLLAAKKLALEAHQIQANSLLPGSASIILRNQNDQLLSRNNETEWEAGLEFPIWLSGQRKAREAIANMASQNLSADAQYLRLQLSGMVRDALWDIQLMQGLVTIANAKHEAASQLQRDIEKRVSLGDMAHKDLLIAQTERLQAESELINADAEVQHAKFRYKNLTGLSIMPAEFAEIKSAKINVQEAHPALIDANSKLNLSAEQRNLVRIENRDNPTVTIGTRSLRGASDTAYNNSLGITLRIPLQSATRNAPLQAAAEMQYAENQAHLSQLKLLLAAAMHEAEHNLEVGSAQIDVLTKQHNIAQQSLSVTRKAFQLGELDLSDLIRIQTQAFNAERSLKNQQIQQLWNTARYNQAVGELP
ncbi:MAG: TolC family protein [Bdellovibrio sp.]|nr:TolC family protein [Methylotenera sp.]